jgi:hypothetical protein
VCDGGGTVLLLGLCLCPDCVCVSTFAHAECGGLSLHIGIAEWH